MPHIQPTASMLDRVKVCTIDEETEYWLWGTFSFKNSTYAILSVKDEDNNHALPFILMEVTTVEGAQRVTRPKPELNQRLYNLAAYTLHALFGLPHVTCMKKSEQYINTVVISHFEDDGKKIFIFRFLDDVLNEMEGAEINCMFYVAEQPEPDSELHIIERPDPRLPHLLSRLRPELELLFGPDQKSLLDLKPKTDTFSN